MNDLFKLAKLQILHEATIRYYFDNMSNNDPVCGVCKMAGDKDLIDTW